MRAALGERPLDLLVNTHLHSDHCGGNAALQAAWPAVRTSIPPGLAEHVRNWDPEALTYAPTGQSCPQFRFDTLLHPGTEIRLGDRQWQVHAAPGHDTHSVILFEPAERILVSADALWERGFGVVFPELEGDDAFDELGETLDLIESLAPALVIPGHGAIFTNVDAAVAIARERLKGFLANPAKHTRHAAKVLLKFKLLEVQQPELRRLRRLGAGHAVLSHDVRAASFRAGFWAVDRRAGCRAGPQRCCQARRVDDPQCRVRYRESHENGARRRRFH